MAISAIMTLNILEYIRKSLNPKTLVCLYQKPLNCPNITYTIALITSFSYEDLNFLILPKISSIEKTMIFIDSIEKGIALGIYLRAFLLDNLKDRGYDIIKFFSSIFKVKTKIIWAKAFFNSDTKIIICTDATRRRINISDIKHYIQ